MVSLVNLFIQSHLVAYMKYKVDTIELSTQASVNFIFHIRLFKCTVITSMGLNTNKENGATGGSVLDF